MAGGIKLTVKVSSHRKAQELVNNILTKLQKPDLHRAVNRVGKYWQGNFKSQGSAVGGWAGLAASTVEDRIRQGYGAGPIMFRYGSLYRMSASYFAEAKSSGTKAQSTPYDKRSGHTTRATLRLTNGRATLGIAGPKVYNQWPSSQGRPARPFWPFNAAVHQEARKGVIEWIVEDVILGRSD